jgi:hypothetical protein
LQEIEQADAAQVGVSWWVLHASPQPPQFAGSVVMLVAQLLFELSQLAKPGLHWLTWHCPLEHSSVEFADEHTCPHEPQSFVFDATLVSQPFAGFLSQSSHPLLHDTTAHCDAEQLQAALSPLHAVPHAPQLLVLVVRSKHPAAGPPPGGQSVGGPSLHTCPQLVPSHVELPFVGTGHGVHDVVPHELVDVLRTQVAAAPVPQLCAPAGHEHSPP